MEGPDVATLGDVCHLASVLLNERIQGQTGDMAAARMGLTKDQLVAVRCMLSQVFDV
jgi:hypothetical protein